MTQLCEFGGRGTIGLALRADNTSSEPEMRVLLGADVAVFAARVTDPGPPDRPIEPRLESVDSAFVQLGALPIGIAALAISDATYAAGLVRSTQLVQALERYHGFPILSAPLATAHALDMLQARRIGLVTAYGRRLIEPMTRFFEDGGYRVTDVAHAAPDPTYARGLASTSTMSAAARTIDTQTVDAIVFTDCETPSLGAVDGLLAPEQIPVLSASVCLGWCLAQMLAGRRADERSLDQWLAEDAAWRMRLGYEFPSAVVPRPSLY